LFLFFALFFFFSGLLGSSPVALCLHPVRLGASGLSVFEDRGSILAARFDP
jgi:hypothetical protein